VAVKRLRPGPALDASARRSFLDEARIASQLEHPAIVPVLDWGVVDEAQHIVFPFVDGLDGQRLVRARRGAPSPLAAGPALFVIATVAEALAFAHDAADENGRPLKLVHRDVSPANLLLGWDGYVGLTDFGIAQAVDRAERTATGVVKGKLGYVAPERLEERDVGPEADVYALGATLHTLLAHHPPHRSWTALRRHPEPPIDDAIPGPLATLIAICMQREPGARPTARAVAEAARELGGPDATAPALTRALGGVAQSRTGQLDDLFATGTAAPAERVRLDDAARRSAR
jgi:serine/threonine-protein kinase